MNIFEQLYDMTAIQGIIDKPGTLIMLAVGFFILYLGIYKKYEPLLLVPIGFGLILANALGGNMAVVSDEAISHMTLIEIAKEYNIRIIGPNVLGHVT